MDVLFLDLHLRLPFSYGLVSNRQGNPAPVRYRIPPAIVLPPPRTRKKTAEKADGPMESLGEPQNGSEMGCQAECNEYYSTQWRKFQLGRCYVLSGVAQGSVLGPYCFRSSINNLDSVVSSHYSGGH
jgi:hypothetical protein